MNTGEKLQFLQLECASPEAGVLPVQGTGESPLKSLFFQTF